MKKKYVKPTMKLVEWNFQNPICNTVCQHSPCIVIDDEQAGTTRIDHIHHFTNDELGEWNVTPSANSNRWN